MTDPREAAALPPDDLAEWIVGRFESPISPKARAGLLDDIEAAIRYRDGVGKGTAAGPPAETGPEGALDRPDEQAVAEALRWFRDNPDAVDWIAGTEGVLFKRHAATIVRAALAAEPACRYCGTDCSEGRSWDGDGYACPTCSDRRSAENRAAARPAGEVTTSHTEVTLALGARIADGKRYCQQLLDDPSGARRE